MNVEAVLECLEHARDALLEGDLGGADGAITAAGAELRRLLPAPTGNVIDFDVARAKLDELRERAGDVNDPRGRPGRR
jgi:hypothetical protein